MVMSLRYLIYSWLIVELFTLLYLFVIIRQLLTRFSHSTHSSLCVIHVSLVGWSSLPSNVLSASSSFISLLYTFYSHRIHTRTPLCCAVFLIHSFKERTKSHQTHPVVVVFVVVSSYIVVFCLERTRFGVFRGRCGESRPLGTT